MKPKTVLISLLVVFNLSPLLFLLLSNKTFGALPGGSGSTATAKCLYVGAGGDCGSCTCSGVGWNGECTTTGFKPAGCYNANNVFEECHRCNIPQSN